MKRPIVSKVKVPDLLPSVYVSAEKGQVANVASLRTGALHSPAGYHFGTLAAGQGSITENGERDSFFTGITNRR
jgi:hypothetical protein